MVDHREAWGKALSHEELLNREVRRFYAGSKSSFGIERMGFEELKSWGWEGLLRAVETWDVERGPFESYASKCVRTAIADGARLDIEQRGGDRARGKNRERITPLSTVPLDEDTHDRPEESKQPPGDEPSFLRLVLEEMLDHLPELERRVIELSFFEGQGDGCIYGPGDAAIAKELGLTSGHAVVALRRKALRRLKKQVTLK